MSGRTRFVLTSEAAGALIEELDSDDAVVVPEDVVRRVVRGLARRHDCPYGLPGSDYCPCTRRS